MAQATPNAKRLVWLGLRAIVALVLVGLVLRIVGASGVTERVARARVPYVVLAFCLLGAAQWLSAWRWSQLLRSVGRSASVPRLFAVYLVGMFFSVLLPSGFGGDVARVVGTRRLAEGAPRAALTVLFDRLLGLMAMWFIGLVGLAIWPIEHPQLVLCFTLLGGAVIGASLFLLWRPIRRQLLRLLAQVPVLGSSLSEASRAFDEVSLSGARVHAAAALSLLVQAVGIAVFITLGTALSIDAPWRLYFVFYPLVALAGVLPFTLAGLGAREVVAAAIFGSIGLPPHLAVALTMLWFFIFAAWSAVGAVLVTLHRRDSPQTK